MRCAVCDEPFFRYQGVSTTGGLVCSHSCAIDMTITMAVRKLRERKNERGAVHGVDDDKRNLSGKVGNPNV